MAKTNKFVIDELDVLKSLRIPLPLKKGGPLSSKKGKQGYDRKKSKELLKREVLDYRN